jgi:PPK2 family polyphosphate:nucleotide phosphotransferase
MQIDYAWKISKPQNIQLKDYDPDHSADLKKEEAPPVLAQYTEELGALQEMCYVAGHNSILIVLQGMDTSGKDGTIRHVMSFMSPLGVNVHAFKKPSEEEIAHDFLWRIHKQTPGKGMVSIFNRSHYEDVLVVRVHNIVPEKDWRTNYDHINNFEKMLADKGTIIVKFFLHISKEEQLQRLLDREQHPEKRYKLSVGDYMERNYWDDYQKSYEELLEKCSFEHAPWYIVPANKKWYRNLAIAESLVEALRPYKTQWEEALKKRGDENFRELQAYRTSLGQPK